MSNSEHRKDIALFAIQLLRRNHLMESARKVGEESGLFFDLNYLKEMITVGSWGEVEKYLLAFTNVRDNPVSAAMLLVIRKQQHVECIYRGIYQTLWNFREEPAIRVPVCEPELQRSAIYSYLKESAKKNPVLSSKLHLPVETSMPLEYIQQRSQGTTSNSDELRKDLTLFTIQLLRENHMMESARKVGQESGLFFDLNYLEELITVGSWDEVERYLCAFIKVEENSVSAAMFYLIRNQQHVECVYRGIYQTLWNFREQPAIQIPLHEPEVQRSVIYNRLKELTERNPVLSSKLHLPLETSMPFHEYIHQSLLSHHRHTVNDQACTSETGDDRTVVDIELPEISKLRLRGITNPSQCRSMILTDTLLTSYPISKLAYSHSGALVVALASNGVHAVWGWKKSDRNETGTATTTEHPQIYKLGSGDMMKNELNCCKSKCHISCFALSNHDSFLFSLSGGYISIFNMLTYQKVSHFGSPPPQPMVVALNPKDSGVVAIGMDDSSIHVYSVCSGQITKKIHGHQREVTGLAFSTALDVLVSSGADGQLCIWSTDEWKKQAGTLLMIPTNEVSPLFGIYVQLHLDQKHLLAVHQTLLAIYLINCSELRCISKWIPEKSCSGITCATYSCDGVLIYACFGDGTVGVLTAAPLNLVAWISPDAYIPSSIRENVSGLLLTAVAAHPIKATQFALGLSNGVIYVLEPLKPKGRWPLRKM